MYVMLNVINFYLCVVTLIYCLHGLVYQFIFFFLYLYFFILHCVFCFLTSRYLKHYVLL